MRTWFISIVLLAVVIPTGLPVTTHAADSTPSAGSLKDVRILHHEAVDSLVFTPLKSTSRAPGLGGVADRLSFDAFGQHFDLALEANERLIERLPIDQQKRITATHQLYKGQINGVPGSWVRLTKSEGQWTGLIWDGDNLYALEPRDAVASALQPIPTPEASGMVLYRLLDISSSGSCGIDPHAQPLRGFPDLLEELRQLAPALPAAMARLNISVIGDTFFAQNQANPEGTAATLFNAVDGIYQEQVGIETNVVSLQLLSNNGNLTSSSPQTLLNQLSNLSNSPDVDNPGLLHLLTGRNLNGGTIGIAFLGSLCSSRFGVGLSEIRNGGMGSNVVLIAHELGHNFGAPHDNQDGSACSSTPAGFIMNPSINGASNTFSTCSLQQMQPEIASASCIVDLPGDDDDDDDNNTPLLRANFNANREGFEFEADTNANNARFTLGRRDPTAGVGGSGALRIDLGGIDNTTATQMEANWTQPFTGSGSVTLRLDAKLMQTPHYERDEFSEIGVVLDGQLIVFARIVGNGNGGSNRSTGFRTFSRTLNLGDGNHTLALNCFNNKKTYNNERTTCLFDNVRIE